MSSTPWRRSDRTELVVTPHLRVYEDKIKLPNEDVVDYTIVNLNSPVIVVATDSKDRVLIMREYRYAHDEMMYSLPAGAIDNSETPVEAAKRELLEETGYGSDEFEYVGELYEYPTKLDHITHVVRARNIKKVAKPHHESTEQIEDVSLRPQSEVMRMVQGQEIKTAVVISALYLALK